MQCQNCYELFICLGYQMNAAAGICDINDGVTTCGCTDIYNLSGELCEAGKNCHLLIST